MVDEYDAPILNQITDPEKAREIQKVLAGFFNAVKSLDDRGLVHAIFITGVTQFAKTSIFSAMNKLKILSMNEDAAQLLGYTKEEIELFFVDHIPLVARNMNRSTAQFLDDFQSYYNGYRFSAKKVTVYNPFSVNNCLDYNLEPRKTSFENYWAHSGTPMFLVELLKKNPASINIIDGVALDSRMLQSFDIAHIDFPVILFQAGYLTIKKYDEESDLYELGFPNHEVRITFFDYLIAFLTHQDIYAASRKIVQCRFVLEKNDIETFVLS